MDLLEEWMDLTRRQDWLAGEESEGIVETRIAELRAELNKRLSPIFMNDLEKCD